MKIINHIAVAATTAQLAFAAPAITDVTAQQRYPWNGKVDITYTVSGDIAAATHAQAAIPSLKVTARDQDTGSTYTATALSGDTGLGDGTHKIVWDMDAQGLSLKSTNVVFSVSCETTPATYCVIDLSAGTNASSYPVTYLAAPPSGGFNVDEYKTTKLVLKRIEAGSFQMGDDKVNVTLTKPFFLGLFEMTQKQYQLVTGSNPSGFSGDKKPVEKVSYNSIRGSSNGAKWPESNAVDADSFLGKLRALTGLDFDLPTEAQWEYACRAGTTTTYSYGNSENGNYMWYNSNSSSQTHEVGMKSPNPWGLYDMHGNVWEWCLDWYASSLTGETDPKGSSSGSYRVKRGGSWCNSASGCTSSYRNNSNPSDGYNSIGFRLSGALNQTTLSEIGSSCSNPTTIWIVVPAITDVTAQQRYPWNGKVDITYTVADVDAAAKEQALITSLKVTARDQDTGSTYTATALSGDIGLTHGTHAFVWDIDAQGLSLKSTNVVFSVSCETTPATYCVIDLSAGANASSYPVTYLAAPPSGGFNVDEYKTTKLVLKRIEAGSFQMGDDKVNVTLTKPFFLGLFEMTQKQYQLVTGSNPSNFSGDKKPVEQVSYDAIRGLSNGAKWPESNAVDADSFLGKLRARTGLDFDLPTEAQWEYACRAGTTTTYSYGDSADGNYMWYKDNSSSQPHEVGMKSPNPWGLYDMHGNVWEWCLDWYEGSLVAGMDPKGSSSGAGRIRRGGGWLSYVNVCTSSWRDNHTSTLEGSDSGFRLSRPLNTTTQSEIGSNSSEPTTVGFQFPDTPVIAPAGGVVESWPRSVTMSCTTEGATIHYTTDGTDPTADSPVYRRFRISERTTVKAVAIWNGLCSAVAIAEFAAGQCADPVITPVDGTEFEHSGQTVSIDWQGEDGVLCYTTDGSDPTAESPVYSGPFTIDETTVVKAKAFGDQFFDSTIVTAALTRVWVNVATPVVTAESSFTGSKTQVSLSSTTEGSTIRYTLDGSDPDLDSAIYTEPFAVTESCTVKAYAVCEDYLDSAVVSFAIEKVWGIGDTMGNPDQVFTTGGDLPFVRVDDATAPLGESMRSGAITHKQTSTMTTTVDGPGTVSFQWKTSCEDSDGMFDWDHAEFEVDGTVVAYLDGESDWKTVSHAIEGDGSHTLLWRYVKDDVESEGGDCCWVADFCWTPQEPPSITETQTTPEPVPYAWLDQNAASLLAAHGGDYEAAANSMAANGVNKVWECYVAGISPTDEAAKFEATIEMGADGKPVVKWNPPLSEEEAAKRTYRTLGKKTFDSNEEWTDVTDVDDPDAAGWRFFKVKVEMR